MPEIIDLRGRQFGRLLVTGPYERRKRHTLWGCRCECGTEAFVGYTNLVTGKARSCGCLNRELRLERIRARAAAPKKAPTPKPPEYNVWTSMRQRCTDPNTKSYQDYGGRGITVCERWSSYENFIADMGPRPSPQHEIDRIDNDLGYSPENCHWVTHIQQANNRRSNVYLTYNGETLTIAEWGRRTGIGLNNVWQRIHVLGWTVERALTTPLRQWPSQRKPKT